MDQKQYSFTGGVLVSITDRNGNTQTLSYDASGNLTQVLDSSGRWLRFGYGKTRARPSALIVGWST